MADQTFAARLRERAALCGPFGALLDPMHPDEAEAIADALEKARELLIGLDNDIDPGHWAARGDLEDALDRLNARVAVKSAEGQPGS